MSLVLVSSGHSNKNTIDWWLKQQAFFFCFVFVFFLSQFWKLRSLRSRCQQISSLVTACFLAYRQLASPYSFTWLREIPSLCLFLYRHTSHSQGFHPSWSNYFSKFPPQIPEHWGLGINIWLLKGHKHSVYIISR